MIQEQQNALANLLTCVKRSEIIDFINQIGYKKIYAYSNINSDLKNKTADWIIRATNHQKFSYACPFYVIEGDYMRTFSYYDIDFTELAEYFSRYIAVHDIPEAVQEVLRNSEAISLYVWNFINYVAYKSGEEAGKIQDKFIVKNIELGIKQDWRSLYWDIISIL